MPVALITGGTSEIELTLIANQMLRVPPSPWIKALQVPSGFDVADRRIA